jgi:tetratricopeptide (TPR) repeat protein
MKTKTTFLMCFCLAFFTGKSLASTCDSSVLAQKFASYAAIAESYVDPADKTAVLNIVSGYPEGSQPPSVIEKDGQYQVDIPSKAAAFFLVGVEALLQNNKLVAAWCFLEAAKRNPSVPVFLNNVAFALIEYDLFSDAKQILECAKSIAPDFTSVYVNLGAALDGLGDHMSAASNYWTAFLDNPSNSDYLHLAATEAKKAGQDAVSWLLAQHGQGNFPQDHDFNTLVSSLNYPPASRTCEVPLSLLDSSYWTVQNEWLSETVNYKAWVDNYVIQSRDPAEDAAVDARNSCKTQVQKQLDACLDEGETPRYVCECRYLPLELMCDLNQDSRIYNAYLSYYGADYGRLHQMFNNKQSILSNNQNQLTSSELSSLTCQLVEDNNWDLHNFFQGMDASLINLLGNFLISKQNVASSIAFCKQIPYEVWLSTGGQLTGSVEPSWCLAFFCFSADDSGNVSVSVAALGAIKLTKNVISGEWGLSLGIGLQFGVGPVNAGGAVYLKSSKNKVGVEPKVSFGPFDLGYSMAFEHLTVSPLTVLPKQ